MTTPESLDLQRILAQMLSQGVTHVVMEASSHAIDLYRIRNCWFDVAVFTNLSQDHLDFHGDMQSYWSSKKRLFTEYLTRGPKKDRAVAVINCNDPRGKELADRLPMPVVKIGSASDCEIKAENYQCELIGTTGKAATPGGSFDFKTPLVGVHNVENILSAVGTGAALKIAPQTVKAGIEALAAIPGRLESIENSSGRFVYVDYAHTPDALGHVLSAIKDHQPENIWCVFGCGGDRDQGKRAMMGTIAESLADKLVITTDNPRSEDPDAIVADICDGIANLSQVDILLDRAEAIEYAISNAGKDDIVLIAGKGHETYQEVNGKRYPFSDLETAQQYLSMKGEVKA